MFSVKSQIVLTICVEEKNGNMCLTESERAPKRTAKTRQQPVDSGTPQAEPGELHRTNKVFESNSASESVGAESIN